MNSIVDVDALRERAILSSLAGFPFLLVFAVAWTTAAALSFVLPSDFAPWAYVVLGMPGVPVAIAIERKVAYLPSPVPDPLLPLTLQILFVQIVAFPAILLVWDGAPELMPAAFAAVVGGHFLPFQWVYRTRLYGVLGVAVAVGPFVLALIIGGQSLHFTGFLVGALLLVGAFVAKAHAKRVWLASGLASRAPDALERQESAR